MGTFAGHVLPGLSFLIAGLIMHNDSMNDYFIKMSTGANYESKIFYTKRQSLIALIGILVCIILEVITGFNHGYELDNGHELKCEDE